MLPSFEVLSFISKIEPTTFALIQLYSSVIFLYEYISNNLKTSLEYNDNGFLLKNDLALDDNYTEAADSVMSQLHVDFEPENRI